MGMIRAALALSLAPLAATADPAWYAAPAHPLPVRDAPGGERIGEIAPGAAPLEATGERDGWVRIGQGEGNGWIARDALTAFDPPRLGDTAIPAGLACSGVEPFWSLTFGPDGVRYDALDGEPVSYGLLDARPAEGRNWPVRAMLQSERLSGVAILRPEACADGMSDRTQGWSVDLLLQETGALSLRTGCCRLPPAP